MLKFMHIIQNILATIVIIVSLLCAIDNLPRFLGEIAGGIIDPLVITILIISSIFCYKYHYRFLISFVITVILAIYVGEITSKNLKSLNIYHNKSEIIFIKTMSYIIGFYLLYFLRYTSAVLLKKEARPDIKGIIKKIAISICNIPAKIKNTLNNIKQLLVKIGITNNLLIIIIFLLLCIIAKLYRWRL